MYKRIPFYLLVLAYLAFLAEFFGVLVGLYVSLLVISFFVLMLPTLACFFSFMTMWHRSGQLKQLIGVLSGLWIFLLLLNLFTMYFCPIFYTKTTLTMLLYHMLLVPTSGAIPIVVTGLSGAYYVLIARHVGRFWVAFALALFGLVMSCVAFYFFVRGPYFAQFIISLNSNALNY